MISFKNDYAEGAHPSILKALMETNLQQEDGYGEDRFCREAAALIRKAVGREDVDVHFLTGGTQTNLIGISAFLRPHEAAIAADSGHILVHETGAIEATGHKAISMPAVHGKLTPDAIQAAVDAHTDEHMVKPALVYISQTTEVGTVYSLAELEAIRAVCTRNRLLLFVDGARLGSALTARGADMTLPDLARLADAFYIGGTKNGALIGEAFLICNDALKTDFRFLMKQRGALLAKGRLIGIQFLEMFRGNLYVELARYANDMAARLEAGLSALGVRFLVPSASNQLFPILPNAVIERLAQSYAFHVWAKEDDTHASIRLVTSWATEEDAVRRLLDDLGQLLAV